MSQVFGLAQDVPTGATVAVAVSLNASGNLVEGCVVGYLYP